MAETNKDEAAIEVAKVKTKQVEILKFHPLVAHEVGDQPILEEETAKKLIEMKYAKALK